ncbi:MAG: PRC-barrel domain-containing protein [Legionella sp.]|nr:PRC-barrel domain-containing protein [Legionella sp.]
MKNDSYFIVRSGEVIGQTVKNAALEKLGKIEEMVLDKMTGQCRYLVLSFGGFMGLGDDYFAFPWKSFHYNKEEKCFILNVDKDKLKKENGFDKEAWPDMSREHWQTTVDEMYL